MKKLAFEHGLSFLKRRVGFLGLSVLLHVMVIGGGVFFVETPPSVTSLGPVEVALVGPSSKISAGVGSPKPRVAEPVPLQKAVFQDHSQVSNQPKVTDHVDGATSAGGAASGQPTVLAAPAYSDNPPLEYPEMAQRRGQQGTVQLTVRVSAQGQAIQVVLSRSSGFRVLDEAALKAVRKWRFKPALMGPIPVESTVEVPVKFKLNG